jgi:hypothetical protein
MSWSSPRAQSRPQWAYHDYRGELRHFSRETRAALLQAMGCDVSCEASLASEITAADLVYWRQGVPGVTVLRPGAAGVPIVVPADTSNRRLHWTVSLADGAILRGEVSPDELQEGERREIHGRWLTRRLLALPELPPGDHRLSLSMTALSFTDGAIVMAPPHCYEPAVLEASGRLWGVAVQLYTLRSRTNWGIGDFDDLQTLVRKGARAGADFIGLNPLHALFEANPAHSSPYSPSSREFLNVLYIAVASVPEYAACFEAQRAVASQRHATEVERLRATHDVDYGVSPRSSRCCVCCLGIRGGTRTTRGPRRSLASGPCGATRCGCMRSTKRSTSTCVRSIRTRGVGLRGPKSCATRAAQAYAGSSAATRPRSSFTRGCSGSRTSSSAPRSGSRATSACGSGCTATTRSG